MTETAALLERADLFIGSDSGPAHLAACAGALGDPLQRHEPRRAVAAVVAAVAGPAQEGAVPALPPQGLPAGRPPLHGGPRARPGLPGGAGVVGAAAPRGGAACPDLTARSPRRAGPRLAAMAALAWALVFGVLYAEMIVRARMPRLAAVIRRAAEVIGAPRTFAK